MSDNVLFLWDNAAERAVVTASSEAANMPATNLLDPQRTRRWRGTLGLGVEEDIDITLAADETTPIGAIAIVDHNLTPNGTIQARGWRDAHYGAELEVDVTIEPWAGLYGYGVSGYGSGGYGGAPDASVQPLIRPVSFVPLDRFYDCRYWCITLQDPNLAYVEAGVVYVGNAWQPEVNMNWGSALGREPRTKKRRSRGGQDYGNTRPGRAFFTMELGWLDPVDRDAIWLRYLDIEDHTPFIFAARPTSGVELLTHTMYGKFEPFEMTASHKDNSRTRIKIIEDL